MSKKIATFGAGCFWCLEAAMNQLKGVELARSGYMGGHTPQPDYHSVCSGLTGHAEVVQVHYDDAELAYDQLCLLFFKLHDPTQLNRQGNDVGTQYRSVIFYHDASQQQQASDLIASLSSQQLYSEKIVTELSPATDFFVAEDYHQGYFLKHPEQGYCQFLIAPKLAKFQQDYLALLK